MIQLPRFQKTDIGWLTTLPEQYGTFLGKPIDICIGDFNFRRAQPHPDMVAPIIEILEELPVILKQAEKALQAQRKKDPDTWPQIPDPCLSFNENFWDAYSDASRTPIPILVGQ